MQDRIATEEHSRLYHLSVSLLSEERNCQLFCHGSIVFLERGGFSRHSPSSSVGREVCASWGLRGETSQWSSSEGTGAAFRINWQYWL